jgi:6-phosphogluconolactonase
MRYQYDRVTAGKGLEKGLEEPCRALCHGYDNISRHLNEVVFKFFILMDRSHDPTSSLSSAIVPAYYKGKNEKLSITVYYDNIIPCMGNFLYVSLRDDDAILCFNIDGGTPRDCTKFNLEGGPAPMAANPQKTRIFAGLRKSSELACLKINPDGALSLLSKTTLPSDPCFVETDNSGAYIFTTYYSAGNVAVHQWDEDRMTEIQRIVTEPKSHSIRLDPQNRYAYVPHTGPNKIYLFDFKRSQRSESGTLEPRNPLWLIPDEHLEPRHLCFHPFCDRLYALNECSSTLSVYDFNPHNGNIVPKQTISTLPPGFSAKPNHSAELRISKDGRCLYASNRGHDSIACFKIDENTGCLSIIAIVPSAAEPRSFDLSPDGRYLYAAGLSSGRLITYAVDPNTGNLSEISDEFIGNCPMWVLALPL